MAQLLLGHLEPSVKEALQYLRCWISQARNLLLNPLQPAIAQVALVDQLPFRLDRRLAAAALP